jgi:large repetitive protein
MGRSWTLHPLRRGWAVTILVVAALLAIPVVAYAQAEVATSPRFEHTATLLDDGRVLVAGGITAYDGPPLSIAELYDPTAGAWAPTGSMTTGRILATATRLTDGTVLVTGGGGDGYVALASAERYDPVTGMFTPTGPLSTARIRHTATLLDDGCVLVVGGGGSENDALPLASAEIYDPMTGTFTPTGSMTTPRGFHTATRLADGRVLISGGFSGPYMSPFLASAEVWDPVTGTFTPTGSMAVPRSWATATLLADGSVLIVGGGNTEATYAAAERYDPTTGTFGSVGTPVVPGGWQTATLLDDGRVLVAGGYGQDDGDSPAPLRSAELYDPMTGDFTRTGAMATPHMMHTATLLPDGRVLIVGGGLVRGDDEVDRPVTSVEIYDPATGMFTAG